MRSTATLLLLLAVYCPALRAQEAARTLEFVENRGQWDARARYAAPVATGARLFAEATGLTYALCSGLPSHAPAGEQAPAAPLPLKGHALRVEFVRPDAHATLLAEEQTPGRRHYLRGADPARWAGNVAAYRQLRYQELWPGTDLVLRENDAHQLEYDVRLAAGADPGRVRLRYAGATALRLDPGTGQLVVETSAGPLTEQRPTAWQDDPATGRRQPVACAFRLRGQEVSFALGRYDRRRPLVIDPVVQFASYTGSPVENWGFAATPDAAGNLYTAGVVFEPGYPTTTGAYQPSFSGSTDMAIMKFNTSTSGPGARAWATYLGGNNLEFPHSLLVNARGELLLLGTTSSTDFPTTAAAASRVFGGGTSIAPYGLNSPFVLANGSDLVLCRLSAGGGQLRASTYLGGSANDGLLDPAATGTNPNLRYNYGDAFRGDLALDGQGNVYLASVTRSADFPGLGSTAAYRGGFTDGLVASLDSSFSQIRWVNTLGGTGADAAYSLQRDETTGDLWVAGGTTSGNLAGAAGGYQAALAGGIDGFVTRLTAGGSIIQSTYLGTSSYDQAYFVRRAPGGPLYVLGQTLTGAWPGVSASRYVQPNGHQFIQQLAPDLRSAGFATVFGTGRTVPDISPTAFDVDCYGRLFLAGWGGGLDPHNGSTVGLDVTPNALQTTTDGMDFYLMQLSDGAQTLEYATFFGTSADDHVDGGTSRFGPLGTLYQAVCACNQGSGGSLPIPVGASTYAPHNGSAHCNNAAFKFGFTAGASPAGVDTLTVCARSGIIRLGGSPAGGTWTGTGVTGSVAAGYFFTPDTARLGTFVLTYTSPLGGLCAGTSTRRITVAAQARARISAPGTNLHVCLRPQGPPPALIPLTGTPAGGTFTGVGVVAGTATFDAVLAGPGVHQITYLVPNGRCPAVAVLNITVEGRRFINVGPPRTVCANDPPVPLPANPPGGVWVGPGVGPTMGGGFEFTPDSTLVGTNVLVYIFPGSSFCPGARDTLRITVVPASGRVTVPADTAVCVTGAAVRLSRGRPAGGTWTGPGVMGTVATGFVFTPTPTLVGTQTLTYTGIGTNSQCPPRAFRAVQVNAGTVRLSAPTAILCTTAGPQPLTATPPGGTWTGPGVTGSPAAGYVFTPSAALLGLQTLAYLSPASTNPAQCQGSGQLRLTVVPFPAVHLDSIPPLSFCAAVPPHGEVLTAQPPGGQFGGPGVVGNRFNPSLSGPGRHRITYTVPFLDCEAVATTIIEVRQLAAIQLPADTVLCFDQTPFRVRATPAGGTWSGPNVTAAGLFTPPASPSTSVLTYTLPGGCGSGVYRVTVPPEPTFRAGWTVPACPANLRAPRHLRFEASGPAAARVRWDFGDGSAPATGAVVEHTYAGAGRYLPRATLPGTGAGGVCPAQYALPPVDVQTGRIPNIITPNGDGLNETFAPEVGGCPGRLQVYSRWGQRVFDSPEYHSDWNGAGQPAGLYYYLLSGTDGAPLLKGWVEIVR